MDSTAQKHKNRNHLREVRAKAFHQFLRAKGGSIGVNRLYAIAVDEGWSHAMVDCAINDLAAANQVQITYRKLSVRISISLLNDTSGGHRGE